MLILNGVRMNIKFKLSMLIYMCFSCVIVLNYIIKDKCMGLVKFRIYLKNCIF